MLWWNFLFMDISMIGGTTLELRVPLCELFYLSVLELTLFVLKF